MRKEEELHLPNCIKNGLEAYKESLYYYEGQPTVQNDGKHFVTGQRCSIHEDGRPCTFKAEVFMEAKNHTIESYDVKSSGTCIRGN